MKIKRADVFLILVLSVMILPTGCSKLILVNVTDSAPPAWTMSGGNAARTHFSTSDLDLPIELKWKTRLKGALEHTFLAADSAIIIATKDGQVQALHQKTGKKVGTIKLPKEDAGTMVYHNGQLLITLSRSRKSTLLRSLSTGKKIWHAAFGPVVSGAAIYSASGFVATLMGQVIRFDLETGKKQWTFNGAGQIHSSPAIASEAVIVANDQGKIIALELDTGKQKWQFDAGTAIMATPVISESSVFIGNTDSTFLALNLLDGSERWRFHTKGKIYLSAATDSRRIYIGSTDHYIYCLDLQTGKPVWKFKTGSVVSTSPLLTGRYVVIGSLDKNVYILDARTGESVWHFETEGRVRTNPIIVNGELIIGSENGDVYCFKKQNDPV